MSDGHVNKCKTCNKKDNTKNRKDKLEYYTAYEKKRAMLPHRVKKRKEYAQSENGKKIINNLHRKWVERNPKQAKANWSVSNAIRDGKIVKGPCEICGNTLAQAHHDDYNFPLKVRWLCTKHHNEWHKHNEPVRASS